MVQEIITYIIIAIAVSITTYKFYINLSGPKKRKSEFKSAPSSTQHNCSDCIAECSLRDAAPLIKEDNESLCKTTVVKIKEP